VEGEDQGHLDQTIRDHNLSLLPLLPPGLLAALIGLWRIPPLHPSGELRDRFSGVGEALVDV
jgi:hypothetical protein